jgi:AraC-like DNA-binding protein
MAELLLVDVMRRYLKALPSGQIGWLAGLRDPLVARALALLHNAPAYGWTLDALAAHAATSRSVLAERFVLLIGQPPIHYLRALRMQLACRLLSQDGAKAVSVARAVGFESEAAFSRAFKKSVGLSPTNGDDNTHCERKRLASMFEPGKLQSAYKLMRVAAHWRFTSANVWHGSAMLMNSAGRAAEVAQTRRARDRC